MNAAASNGILKDIFENTLNNWLARGRGTVNNSSYFLLVRINFTLQEITLFNSLWKLEKMKIWSHVKGVEGVGMDGHNALVDLFQVMTIQMKKMKQKKKNFTSDCEEEAWWYTGSGKSLVCIVTAFLMNDIDKWRVPLSPFSTAALWVPLSLFSLPTQHVENTYYNSKYFPPRHRSIGTFSCYREPECVERTIALGWFQLCAWCELGGGWY